MHKQTNKARRAPCSARWAGGNGPCRGGDASSAWHPSHAIRNPALAWSVLRSGRASSAWSAKMGLETRPRLRCPVWRSAPAIPRPCGTRSARHRAAQRAPDESIDGRNQPALHSADGPVGSVGCGDGRRTPPVPGGGGWRQSGAQGGQLDSEEEARPDAAEAQEGVALYPLRSSLTGSTFRAHARKHARSLRAQSDSLVLTHRQRIPIGWRYI